MIAHPASGPGTELAPVMAHAAPAAVTGTALPLVMTLLFVVAALSAFAYWSQRRGNDSDDGGSGPGWGGPQQHPPDDGPAGDEFPWWPEFERRFGDYLKSRGHGRSGSRHPPDGFWRTTLRHDHIRRSAASFEVELVLQNPRVTPTEARLRVTRPALGCNSMCCSRESRSICYWWESRWSRRVLGPAASGGYPRQCCGSGMNRTLASNSAPTLPPTFA
jgi:hypothetical protein